VTRTLGVLFAIALAAAPALPAAARAPVSGRDGMVVSAESHATDVGLAVLAQGGNAFDAAVAVGFALAVTHPAAGNLGGGGFCVALTADGETLFLDFREVAPAAATAGMYLDAAGEVVPGLSTKTHLAVGVPGSVAGLLRLLADHGTWTREEILAPAIALARDGFPVSPHLHRALENDRSLLTSWPHTAALFFPGGEALAAGAPLRQRDLAGTLERIARRGEADFYEGRTAALFLAEMECGDGLVTAADLRAYRPVYREPFVFTMGPHEFITPSPPSSGGIVLAQILGLVDLGELARAGFNSAEYVRRVVEAERLAYADRNHYLGDPGFVNVPVAELVSTEYLAARRLLLPAEGAGCSDSVGAGIVEPMHTTHYCVADGAGNVVAVTTTLNDSFGTGALVPGAGFLLNNEMDDFSAKPGAPNLYGLTGADANAIAPGKRMLSSMTPTIVCENGEFLLTMGAAGGGRIITACLQIYLNVALFGMDIADALAAGRFHHQWLPDRIDYEPHALSLDAWIALRDMGYSLRGRTGLARAAAILHTPDGLYTGAADPRGGGKAAGFTFSP
jgi:gamma-glutamyltranspeptidase/glutathione hydrolase